MPYSDIMDAWDDFDPRYEPPSPPPEPERPIQDWYNKNISPIGNQFTEYLRRSGKALAGMPQDLAKIPQDIGRKVALPFLQQMEQVHSTDWSQQPFIGIGEKGEFTGRLPALASYVTPYLLGAAPSGSLSAGIRLPEYGGRYEGGYHGTPHTFVSEPGFPFGRFNPEFMSTGAGGQSQGYGHYVAGRKASAEGYVGYGPDKIEIGGNGFVFDPYSVGGMSKGESEAAIYIYSRIKRGLSQDDILKEVDQINRISKTHEDFLPTVKDWVNKGVQLHKPEGNLYHIEIKPQEHELLEWHKPLREQHPDVQEKLTKMLKDKGFGGDDPIGTYERTSAGHGETFYQALTADLGSDRAASAALHEAGVPGIRYPDASSRMRSWDIRVNGKPIASAGISPDIAKEVSFQISVARDQNPKIALENMRFDKRSSKEAGDWLEKNIDSVTATLNPQTYNYVIFHPNNLRVIGRENSYLRGVI